MKKMWTGGLLQETFPALGGYVVQTLGSAWVETIEGAKHTCPGPNVGVNDLWKGRSGNRGAHNGPNGGCEYLEPLEVVFPMPIPQSYLPKSWQLFFIRRDHRVDLD